MRQEIISQVEQYCPFNDQERADREIMLSFLKQQQDVFYRSSLVAHMTASCWILNQNHNKVLMAYHNIYDSWAWLGGHADGNEDLKEVALKEAREESGIEKIRLLSEEIFSLENLSVDGHFKRGKYVPTHLHLNITYLMEADDSQSIHNKADENRAVGWFGFDEMMDKVSEVWFKENIYRKLVEKVRRSGI